MEKRGLSEVISAVLFILIVLVSISIIWLFLKPVINQVLGDSGSGNDSTESGEIGKFTSCLKLDLTLTNCNLEDSGIYKIRVDRGIGLFDIKEIKFKFKTINTEFILTNNTDFPDEFGSKNYYFNLSNYTDKEIMNVEVAAILSNGNACDFGGKYSCFEFIPSGNDGNESNNSEKFLDLDYLLDVTVSIFLDENGKKTFTVDYNGKRLRENFTGNANANYNEKFYEAEDLVSVDYDIVKQKGGVDVVYTVSNLDSLAHGVPNFTINGILISNNLDDNLQYLRAKSSVGFKDISSFSPTYIEKVYPTVEYSPVIVQRDKNYAVGSSFQYPYLNYKQVLRVTLGYNTNQNSPMYGTWSHRYREFKTEPNGDVALIQPGQILYYNVSLRFSNNRNWIFTLYPYKKYFNSLYGSSSGNINSRDRTPVIGKQLGDSGGTFCVDGNQRCYRNTANVGRVDNLGWGPFTDWFIQTAQDMHYTRVLLWTPGGVFNQSISYNFPPQFMSDWLPYVASSDSNFTRYATNNIELGFWWSRSSEIPVPVQWNPSSLVDADYNNPTHVDFLTNELNIAVGRGAKLIGLDEFSHMPVYQRYNWIDDMKAIAPEVIFTHESTGPDFMHRKLANHADPNTWGDINSPDLLSWYLNPESEIYVLGVGSTYNSLAFMQEMSKWGYTPNPKDTLTIDANEINQPLVECFDGRDNDNDGRIDYYDLDCEDELGTSES